MITTRSIKVLDDDVKTRQELDLDFLNTGYRRKVYVASERDLGCRLSPQRPGTSVLLVPIPVGEGVLGCLTYLDAGGRVQRIPLRSGRYYYIPPGVPYEIAVSGIGVLEVYAPITSPVLWFDAEPLPDDYFHQLASTPETERSRNARPEAVRVAAGDTTREHDQ
ncbi:MAG TPA: hypothetical protein VFQ76_05735 [Longimicrobiaceae bacterium]|nr:hypothetical protein [Longimicrobiaceae bacterium]